MQVTRGVGDDGGDDGEGAIGGRTAAGDGPRRGGDQAPGTAGGDKRLRARRRLFVVAALGVVIVVSVIAVAVIATRGSKGPDETQVSQTLRDAITTAAGDGGTAPFDTRTIRTSLQTELRGWVVDLATSDDRRRLGVAARRLSDSVCVLAWSGVGLPQSAIVTDPMLPCLADIALVPARDAA